MQELPALQREVKVELDQQRAFELFTTRVAEWWPLTQFSVYGEGSTVAFALRAKLVERNAGRTAQWAEVQEWSAGERLALRWHPRSTPEDATRVTVSFTAYKERTLVTLEHSGWDAYEDPVAARDGYAAGWQTVLNSYAGAANPVGRPDPAGTWVALLHAPGPSAPEGSLFEDPRLAGHISFLNEMEEAGYLVAAGPTPDQPGHGMTVLRLPGQGRLEEAAGLARGDSSVSSGLLQVTVQQWQVIMAPSFGG